ncbi:MAG TPA: acetyl-CoA C-acetyltransferase, partial [Modicisalibacter sp.]|nr:acetyl-CoA C-acetyltransferase [Modicisalibacter sp.]
MSPSSDVVILSGARTPMGGMLGSLSSLTAPELCAVAIRAAIERAGIAADELDEGILGCVLPGGVKQGPGRQAMRQAGIPDGIGATTINKLCGSGMKATMLAHDLIRAGSGELLLAGGMESMSNAPHILTKARGGYRLGHGELKDHMFYDGLEDAETGKLMGVFAQQIADERGYSRERMDDFAIASLERAMAA